jgi:hypothetical protein
MHYKINIRLDDHTLKFLHENDLWLRVYKGAITSAPMTGLLWYTSNSFSNNTVVQWTTDHYGFICSEITCNKGKIIEASLYNMQPGQLLTMDEAGIIKTSTKGMDGVLLFHNRRQQLSTCGLAQPVNGNVRIYTATQLLGDGSNVIIPRETVLLVFESGQLDPAAIVTHSLNSSVLITLREGNASFNISYSAISSWNTGFSPFAQIFAHPVVIADKLRLQF